METVTQSHEFIELKKIMPEIVEMMEKSSVDVQSSINTKFGVEHCFVDPVNETYEEQIKIYEKYYEELVQIADEKEKEILNRTNKENDNSSLLLMLNKLVNYLEESEKSFNQVEIECLELIRTRITEVAGEIDNLREEVFKLNELNLLKKFKEEAALRKKLFLDQTSKLNVTKNNYFLFANDFQLDYINNSLSNLKKWSGFYTCSLLFDTKTSGNNDSKFLFSKIFNKNHLYFITFDENSNVFGGYVSKAIHDKKLFISDEDSFLFSLVKSGEVQNSRFLLKKNIKGGFSCLENNALICFGFVDETNFSIQGSPSIESKLNQSDTTDLKINNISDVNSFYKLNGCAYDCQFNFTSPLPSNSLNSAQPQIGVCNALNLTATVKKDVRQPTKFNESSTQPFNMLGGFFGQPTQPESNDKISFKNTRLVILEME